MPISRLELVDFTAFHEASLKFAPGINVLLGANATGKTHVMKVLYAALKELGSGISSLAPNDRLKEKLARVFRPDDLSVGRLGHRRPGQKRAKVTIGVDKGELAFGISTKTSALGITKNTIPEPPACIFLPSREALAMHEGFVASYTKRELAFDETYYDLAVALSAKAVRGTKPSLISQILDEMEGVLDGKVVFEGDRFYLRGDGGSKLEAHLLSEGMRKIASVVRLLANNELRVKGVLFWDEPEANLNPTLSIVVVNALERLASQGIQVFVATHDYLVSETLGLLASKPNAPEMRFFSFQRSEGESGVRVAGADTLDDLPENLIRAEFLRHYDRVRGLE